MRVSTLFADDGKPLSRLLDDPNFLFGTAGLVGALLAGAVVVYLVDRWRKASALDAQRTGEELTEFRAMYDRGEITEAEYARLRGKVAERVRNAPVPKPAADGGAPAAPPAPRVPPVPGPFPPGYFDDPPPAGETPGGDSPDRAPPAGPPPPA